MNINMLKTSNQTPDTTYSSSVSLYPIPMHSRCIPMHSTPLPNLLQTQTPQPLNPSQQPLQLFKPLKTENTHRRPHVPPDTRRHTPASRTADTARAPSTRTDRRRALGLAVAGAPLLLLSLMTLLMMMMPLPLAVVAAVAVCCGRQSMGVVGWR